MKRMFTFILLVAFVLPFIVKAQTSIYSEDFDSYTVGSKLGVSNSTWWTPWSLSPGGNDDPFISDEQASSPPNSFKIDAPGDQGDYDIILKLGDKTSGKYDVKFKIFVGDQQTHGAYFNVLHLLPANSEWAFSVVLDPDLNVNLSVDNNSNIVGTYTKGVWTDVKVTFDLDKDSASLYINNNMLAMWVFSLQEAGGAGVKQLAGLDFFAYAGGAAGSTVLYYIDDVEFMEYGGTGIAQAAPFEMVVVYPNPTSRSVRINGTLNSDVKIYDITGNCVGKFKSVNNIIDLRALADGVYIAEFLSNNQICRSRIVKQ